MFKTKARRNSNRNKETTFRHGSSAGSRRKTYQARGKAGMRNSKVWLYVLVGVLAAVAVPAVSFVAAGVSARNKPGPIETRFARAARHLMIPRSARRMKNPETATPEVLASARQHFADHCASCHANDGSGGTEMGHHLYPRAPDMREAETQDLSDGELYYIIENGIKLTGMPAWGHGGDTDQDTWKLVLFIRLLPHQTKKDLDDMEQFNPRSPADIKEEEYEKQFLNGQPAAPGKPGPH